MTKLSNLKPAAGSTKRRKRRGIGSSSGHGGTSTRGAKGQNARSGGGVPTWFEGGQMPLIRRIPKRGFVNIFRVENQVVNIRDLARFDAGSIVDLDALVKAGLARTKGGPVKLLATGEIDRALTVKVDVASTSAKQKIEAAGGSVEVVRTFTVPRKVSKAQKAAAAAEREKARAAKYGKGKPKKGEKGETGGKGKAKKGDAAAEGEGKAEAKGSGE